MGEKQETEIKEFDGDLVIYQRDDGRSQAFYARIKIPDKGKWKKFSLGTADPQEALILGREKFKELQILIKHNITVDAHRFRYAAKIALEEIEERIKDGSARPCDYDYQRLIPKFADFFAEKHIESITPADIRRFYTKRASEVKKLKAISGDLPFSLNKSTINNYAAALNRVFEVAVERNWIDLKQVPHLRNEGSKPSRRAAFTLKEIEKLRSKLLAYQQQTTKDYKDGGLKNRSIEIRKFLRNYVNFSSIQEFGQELKLRI